LLKERYGHMWAPIAPLSTLDWNWLYAGDAIGAMIGIV
jgi:hypothetical protein